MSQIAKLQDMTLKLDTIRTWQELDKIILISQVFCVIAWSRG